MIKKKVKAYYQKIKGYNFSRKKGKIDFLIVGAQKCGTTALHTFLSTHNEICGSRPKETNFFCHNQLYIKGYNFYHGFFNYEGKNKLYFEASPSYLQDSDFIAVDRIYEYNNRLKIIIILRDPVERAYSAYQMYKKRRDIQPNWFDKWKKNVTYIKRTDKDYSSFASFVNNEIAAQKNGLPIECPVLNHGKYILGIEKYIDRFGYDNIYIIENSSLRKNTHLCLDKLISFLGASKMNWPFANNTFVFKGNYEKKISLEIFELLKDYYQDYNQRLNEIVKIKF